MIILWFVAVMMSLFFGVPKVIDLMIDPCVSFARRYGIAAGVAAFTTWVIFVLIAYVVIAFLTLTLV
ncbi:hypothetical protein [uncultured Bifidobacterium sp.]|uniref:hypothetical protein n=1 Tax=uncultured Bifidobacterium sp. TaxID=165187 RepID=UPI002593F82D|nr:hypothetical protein [uncultured Bifidobacterium sp.]